MFAPEGRCCDFTLGETSVCAPSAQFLAGALLIASCYVFLFNQDLFFTVQHPIITLLPPRQLRSKPITCRANTAGLSCWD